MSLPIAPSSIWTVVRLLPALVTAGVLRCWRPASSRTRIPGGRRRRALADAAPSARAAPILLPTHRSRPAARPRRPPPRPPTASPPASPIPALRIDLPVVRPPDDPDHFPYCNVAEFIQELSQPGLPGATYLYAHAREGMFLPLLETADGKLPGMLVQVYTSDNLVFLYEITRVLRNQISLDEAFAATEEELWLQTSEGPRGTIGKTQVVARPISVGPADPAAANPKPKPVVCE